MKLDLHTHSNFSDGTLDPEDLVDAANRCGVTHLALSDHDTTAGIQRARTQAEKYNITIIPAIEINTKEDESSVHVLGYLFNETDETFQKTLAHNRELRTVRANAMLEKLRHMGIKINLPDFGPLRENAAIGRPHIADKLREMKIVFSRQEAFDKYLARGKSAYVVYEGPTPQRAIEMILEAKGIPVLAHPAHFISPDQIEKLTQMGLQGIEVYYPTHSKNQIHNLVDLAKKLNLVVTGGSDYHGPESGHEALGEMDVPENVLQNLLDRKQKLFGC